GNFTSTKKIEIYDEEDLVGNLDLGWIFQKGELPVLEAYFEERKTVPIMPENIDIEEVFLHLISDNVIASKELVVRQYDHEVQAHTVIKPMLGVEGIGPSDAVVLTPLYDSYRGIVVSCGINPWYGMIDPYHMAGCCIDEAMRNIVACGGDPERVSLLDNFCWGNCNDSLELGKLTRCVKGCRDFALEYGAPFISGKDSLNNFFTEQDKTIVSIPGTLLISAISVIKDVRKTMSSDFKSVGNLIYILGETKNELGGSRLFHVLNIEGGCVPKVKPEINLSVMKKLYNAINQGLVRSCHDCSEGGLIITISEMMIGSGYGAEIDIEEIPSDIKDPVAVLFSESQGRFIVEVDESCVDRFEKLFQNLPCACIGRIIPAFHLKVFSGDNQVLSVDGEEIKQKWCGALEW
ncbi:MAG TPA: AIR synthase-related protein, partial [bacterium]|nr:AIR synthase-related protein [bacterium]